MTKLALHYVALDCTILPELFKDMTMMSLLWSIIQLLIAMILIAFRSVVL